MVILEEACVECEAKKSQISGKLQLLSLISPQIANLCGLSPKALFHRIFLFKPLPPPEKFYSCNSKENVS
jgi:hypothetical protein